MITARRAKGDRAEDAALAMLVDAGLTLIDRNISSPLGEIDLLMLDGTEWVFVEVRSRASLAFGGAAGSVSKAKQTRLRRQSQVILKARFGDTGWPACRFDVCALDVAGFNWIKNAF